MSLQLSVVSCIANFLLFQLHSFEISLSDVLFFDLILFKRPTAQDLSSATAAPGSSKSPHEAAGSVSYMPPELLVFQTEKPPYSQAAGTEYPFFISYISRKLHPIFNRISFLKLFVIHTLFYLSFVTNKSDVYSLGITAVQVFTEQEPWAGLVAAQIIGKVK
jgi:serine/threonine protein kinase